jgi:hypothetical protein
VIRTVKYDVRVKVVIGNVISSTISYQVAR